MGSDPVSGISWVVDTLQVYHQHHRHHHDHHHHLESLQTFLAGTAANGSRSPRRPLSARCWSMVRFPTVDTGDIITRVTGAPRYVLHCPNWTLTLRTLTQPLSRCQCRTDLQHSSVGQLANGNTSNKADVLKTKSHTTVSHPHCS